MMRRRTLASAALCAQLLLHVSTAWAFIPRAERIEAALADGNRAAQRDHALQLELELRIGDERVVGRGELVTHPQGLARLELRGAGNLVERHLLQGAEHRASRNGQPLENPRAFMPPLFLLQADTATTLRAALSSFGVRVDDVGLAPCGESDCYVVGDPRRVPPPWAPPTPPASEASASAAAGLQPVDAPPPNIENDFPSQAEAPATGEAYNRIWLDQETFELRRIDFANGVRVRFGPQTDFERVRFPAWISVEEPERGTARFDVKRAVAVNAPASAFASEWLFDAVETGGAPIEPPMELQEPGSRVPRPSAQ